MHVGRAPGRRRGQHQPPDDGRSHQRDLLRDETSDGKAEQVCLIELHRSQEGDGIAGHLLDSVRGAAGGTADPGVVERHDAPCQSQRVNQRWVPVVEVPAEVLEQYQRHRALPAATVAVHVIDAVGRTDQFVRQFRYAVPMAAHPVLPDVCAEVSLLTAVLVIRTSAGELVPVPACRSG